MITIESLKKSFGTKLVLDDLNFSIQKQEFVSLLGPSGCGKSTLFKLLTELDPVYSGKIIKDPHLKSAIVFQEPRLLPWLNVSENIRLPEFLGHQPISGDEIKNILKQVNLVQSEKLFPSQISGGMKMRVSLARALLSRPNLLLLDEPLSAVDENNRHKLQELIRKIHSGKGLTTLFITHSLAEAVFLSDRIIMLNSKGQMVFDQPVPLPRDRTVEFRSSELLSKTILSFQKPFQELIA